jgi:hypothetical protein
MRFLRRILFMRRIGFACSAFILLAAFVGGASRCSGSDQQRLIVRDGKEMICSVWFQSSKYGDCGTESYESVFTAKVMAVEELPTSSDRQDARPRDPAFASDLRLTVEPEEVFKGHPAREVEIIAEQGECFAEIRAGDEWLFFGETRANKSGLEISYHSGNPSGPVEQRRDYVERLRRLDRGDGLIYLAGEVDYPAFDISNGFLPKPRPNYKLLIEAEDGKQSNTVTTNAEGRFELGPVAPGRYQIHANTDPQFRDFWGDVLNSAAPEANGCSSVRIELELNSEISGRAILPEGYQYKKSEIGSFFQLFYVDVDTPDGKQVGGTSIGDGLKFTVRGLAPGSYIIQLVNYEGETWIKMPVYAPGVTDKSTALRIDLGLAEHRTRLEIRVPPEALKAVK